MYPRNAGSRLLIYTLDEAVPGKFAVDSPLGEGGFETAGSTSESGQPRHRPDLANRQQHLTRGLPFIWHPSWISNPSYQIKPHLCRKWDQRFESALLQRRVRCEPSLSEDTC
jgi:hypothetical protein